MIDPMGNGLLAVQTIRNNIMASTVLATAAISLTAVIDRFWRGTCRRRRQLGMERGRWSI